MHKGKSADSGEKKPGFVEYVDEIRKAEDKLRQYGVQMNDAEKKQQFFLHFIPPSEKWNTLLTFWNQDSTLTFDDILNRGITEQQALDLKETQNLVSGVRAYAAMHERDHDQDDPPTKRRRGGRGGGGGDDA